MFELDWRLSNGAGAADVDRREDVPPFSLPLSFGVAFSEDRALALDTDTSAASPLEAASESNDSVTRSSAVPIPCRGELGRDTS